MNLYAMSEGVELATLRCILAIQEAQKDDLRAVLAAMPQHPAAMLASAVDDAWIAALESGDEL